MSQAAVLPHVDLVVHHGGSMLGASAAGKPQLADAVQRADQFTNAAAVVEAGAGARLLPAELTQEAVTVTARALLADADTLAAGRLAAEIAAMPSPREVAGRLPVLLDAGGDQ